MDLVQLAQLRIYPLFQDPGPADARSWRIEVGGAFQRLKIYVGRAANAGHGLLVWLS
jgi:hypothetical protein